MWVAACTVCKGEFPDREGSASSLLVTSDSVRQRFDALSRQMRTYATLSFLKTIQARLNILQNTMTSISNATSLCMRSFSLLTTALAAGEREHWESMPPEKIEMEHERFKIWSGNLGALKNGRSSLDSRLRESTLMQSNIMKLLTRLDLILQNSKWISDDKVFLYIFFKSKRIRMADIMALDQRLVKATRKLLQEIFLS